MAANEITVIANGESEPLHLGEGWHHLQITATAWGGATAVLQEGSGGSFADSDDPHNTGNAVSRTADGKLLLTRGGISYRLNVTNFSGDGTTTGLKLIAHYAGGR